ncbi:MAG: DUF4445 domain-containing protein [Fibrobacteria bacterium]|nr:DUF4445 domain-containing protein [Fibrobacteria bacterium]
MTKPSCKVTFLPQHKVVDVEIGTPVLEAASRAGFRVKSLCGGEGTCKGCKMVIKKGKISGGVSGILRQSEIDTGVILSCLASVDSDVEIEIPSKTLFNKDAITGKAIDSFSGSELDIPEVSFNPFPVIQKVYLELDLPSLASNMADHQRICAAIKEKLGFSSIHTSLNTIRSLPELLRENKYCITATIGANCSAAELLYVEAGNTEKENYAIVVDMGTTTIVAHLVDLCSFQTMRAQACFNGQAKFGREVTARMIAAEKSGDEQLHTTLISDLNNLISGLLESSDISKNQVNAIVCAGNTPMVHFLLNIPTRNIRRTPYIPTSVEPSPVRASELGLEINERGLLYALPGISGWVGSDLTAGILATEMYKGDDIALLVDIGTNGEIIVGNKDWLMSCSASAGPSLEGSSVECGMRAEDGAIEKVFAENGEIKYETINNAAPEGFCGSGIIDIISVLLQLKIVNRSGKFIDDASPHISERDGIKAYTLVSKEESGSKEDIYISEADIENLITAKAAIFAAMKILLDRLDMTFDDVATFYLAGAFGKHINIDNAVTIGLIPNIPRERVKFVGNTSLMGSKIATLYREGFEKIKEIEENTTYYDLMGADDYVEEFQKAMFLPHTDIEIFE